MGVLKRMGRRYTPEEYEMYVNNARNVFDNPAVTTDIIAGFPMETPEEHAQTLDFIRKIGFADIHVFAYSERKGTPAARMTQLNMSVRKARASEISQVAGEMKVKYEKSYMQKNVEVLIEEQSGDYYVGHTREYLKVIADGVAGEVVHKKLTGYKNNLLY